MSAQNPSPILLFGANYSPQLIYLSGLNTGQVKLSVSDLAGYLADKIAAGEGLEISIANGVMTISSKGGSATWGAIIGSLAAQADLVAALAAKSDTGHTHETDDLTEGATNLFFTAARAQAAFSCTAAGLSYAAGILALATGYAIPTSAQISGWNSHLANTSNPHGTTAAQTGAIPATEKGQPSGIATLGADGKIPTGQLNPIAITNAYVVNSEASQLALTAQSGDVAVRSDLKKSYIHNGGIAGTMEDWTELLTPADLVLSVNGKTGSITLTLDDIAEGATNKYFNGKTQDNLPDGTTAKQFTAAEKSKLAGIEAGAASLATVLEELNENPPTYGQLNLQPSESIPNAVEDLAQIVVLENGDIDGETKLLCHFEGDSLVDSSYWGKIPQLINGAALSDTQAKFGTKSAYFDGSDDYLFVPYEPDMNFGIGDFCIEFWAYPISTWGLFGCGEVTGQEGAFHSHMVIGSPGHFWNELRYNGSTLSWSPAATILANTWQHIAFDRHLGNLHIFIEGTSIGYTYWPYPVGYSHWYFAKNYYGRNSNMYLDEIRISKGVSRYKGTNFTPASAAFSGNKGLFMRTPSGLYLMDAFPVSL